MNSDKKITSGIDGASVNRLLDEHLSLPSYYFTFSVTDKPKDGYYVNKVIYNDKEVSVPKKGESKETSIDGRIYTVSVDANGTVTVTGPSIIQNNLMFTHAEIPKEVKAEYTVEIYYQLNGKYAEPMGIETRTGKTGTEVSVTDADKTSEKENYVLDESMNDFYTGTIADDGSLVLRVYFKQQMTLTFDLDGGTLNGSTDSVTLTQYYGDEITILDAPEREGYTFLNWKGSEYQPGDSYTVTEDHIFTAQWEEKDRPIPGKNYCPVTWDPNGGIFNESSYPYEKTTGKWLQPAYKGTEIVILSAP
ncbi:MAG: InlB B-repeat-containing protein, partial [Emergencia sp.]